MKNNRKRRGSAGRRSVVLDAGKYKKRDVVERSFDVLKSSIRLRCSDDSSTLASGTAERTHLVRPAHRCHPPLRPHPIPFLALLEVEQRLDARERRGTHHLVDPGRLAVRGIDRRRRPWKAPVVLLRRLLAAEFCDPHGGGEVERGQRPV